ncbi:MAG: NeuD/PglB/VioB family sugar acetyltransferase [Chloroflexota bacterium]
MTQTPVLVPLLNANEPEARLAAIHVRDGGAVELGTVIFTIETTKAAADIEAPAAGTLRLLAREGDILQVGEPLAVVTSTADEPLEITRPVPIEAPSGDLRITKPARTLAEQLGLDLASLPSDRLVTEDVIRQLAQPDGEDYLSLPVGEKPYLLVYGGGGHAKSVIEMVQQAGGHTLAGILDDNLPAGTLVLGVPVLGTRALLAALSRRGVRQAANGVGGILDIHVRVRVFDLLAESGYSFPALVHPRATLEPSSRIGEGVQVFANAYVGSEAVLAPRCMVNTNAVISHDCEIGEYSHIAPGALLAGHVHVGRRTLVGMGATVHIGVRIGDGVRIGNGAIILADVPDKTIVQAGRFWVGKTETP